MLTMEEVFTQANAKLSEGNDSGMFVTAWMGYIDLKTGRISYANAGHNPPLVRHGNGSYEYLKTRPGLVLAGMEGIRYRSNEVELQPGDVLFLLYKRFLIFIILIFQFVLFLILLLY